MASSASIQNMLPAILSVGNQEQSQFYSPRVYTAQYNIVSSLLKSALVKAFPSNPMVLDQLDPFVEMKLLPVVDGFVDLPDNYRDILGTPYIFVNQKSDGECGGDIEPLTAQTFKVQNLKGGCRTRPVQIVPESEFHYRTDSTYNYPTLEAPIGYFAGKKRIKICPYDLSKVAVMFVVEDVQYIYGYITQPDDTFLFDPTTTVDSPWGSNAFEPIFNAMMALYSVYSKDQEMGGWANILNEKGIF